MRTWIFNIGEQIIEIIFILKYLISINYAFSLYEEEEE
jgi:hypothetical protein